MGETKKLHFYDFGNSGRVPEPQNDFFSLETPGYLKKPKKTNSFDVFLQISKLWKSKSLEMFEKIREIPSIRLTKLWKSWIWDKYLPKKHEMAIWRDGIVETLKLLEPRNFETKKLWNKKPKNTYFQVRESPAPSTYRLPHLHPNTS